MWAAPLVAPAMAAAALAGCASKPPEVAVEPPAPPRAAVDASKTTVILLPDEDGHVGAVIVGTPAGSQQIDTAYAFATVAGADSRPSRVESMGEARVSATFDGVLRAQPPKPKSFVLHFLLNGTALTEESKAVLPAVHEAVRVRKPTEIAIFGHTDATGSQELNMRLSAERARAVEAILRRHDPDLGSVEVKFFGSQEPLVPTPPGVPEPRNRRAEIIIL